MTYESDTQRNIRWLRNNIDRINIADILTKEECDKIGASIVDGYRRDLNSREEWEKQVESGMKVAKQVVEKKTYPWVGAANVKHPLIAQAAIQFAARAYPEIVKGTDVVKAVVVGEDADGAKEARAKRVSAHMSYQVIEEMPEWEPDTDTLLHSLPIMGVYFRKTYWSALWQRACSEAISPLDVVVNENVKTIDTARRVTQKLYLYENDIIERERIGQFIEGISEQVERVDDDDIQYLFLECHTWMDLDGDDYAEPYIVTVHEETGKVARIAARYDDAGIKESTRKRGVIERIDAVQYFTKYDFIPSPDGKFYSLGFAHLLGPINESINTVMNQLLDAGTLANLQSGFIGNGLKIEGGNLTFRPGEWKKTQTTGADLKSNIFPLPVRDPSQVLFSLLGLLEQTGKGLASVSETMTGETPGQNVPATTVLAMIEQGLKVFTSIYKRIFRALKAEYRKLYRLNSLYLDEQAYYRVLDANNVVFKKDYELTDLDIIPIADPTISSEAMRLARLRAIMDTMQLNPTIGGRLEILKRYYEGLQVQSPELLLPAEEVKQLTAPQQGPPPDPMIELKALDSQTKAEHDHERLELEKVESEMRVRKMEADIELVRANAIKAIAEAESKEAGVQFQLYKAELDQLMNERDVQMKRTDDLYAKLADHANAKAVAAENAPPKTTPIDIKLALESGGGKPRQVKFQRDADGNIIGADLGDSGGPPSVTPPMPGAPPPASGESGGPLDLSGLQDRVIGGKPVEVAEADPDGTMGA